MQESISQRDFYGGKDKRMHYMASEAICKYGQAWDDHLTLQVMLKWWGKSCTFNRPWNSPMQLSLFKQLFMRLMVTSQMATGGLSGKKTFPKAIKWSHLYGQWGTSKILLPVKPSPTRLDSIFMVTSKFMAPTTITRTPLWSLGLLSGWSTYQLW